MTYKIVLIKVDHRSQKAVSVQDVLTEFGCSIKVRLGLHEVSDDKCANDGLIILQAHGEQADIDNMIAKLEGLSEIKVRIIEM